MINLRQIEYHVQNHPKLTRVYSKKLLYNNNKARLYCYSNLVFCWKNERTDYTKRLKSKTRRADSVERARERIYDIVSANINQHGDFPAVFATFTFADNMQKIRDANTCFRSFIRRLNRKIGYKIKYITVVEFQKRGAVHYHTIFYNLSFIDKFDFENLWGHGWTNIHSVKKIKNLGAYLAKYLTKETFDSRLYGEKTYFCSRGMYRSQEEFSPIAIEMILCDYEISSTNAYKSKTIKIIDYDKILLCKTSGR